MLRVITWMWGSKFRPEDVRKLAAGLRRHLQQPFRFLVCTDLPGQFEDELLFERCGIDEADRYLLKAKGCFARLRMFDPEWQRSIGITPSDRIVGIDVDSIITGPLNPLFNRVEPFVIMQGGNAANPCPYNGALIMLRPGAHAEVWRDFSLEAAARMPFYSFPDDQGWLWHKLPGSPGWKAGSDHGVYVYKKPGWPGGDGLPAGARLVTFINKHPRDLAHLDWVKEHWCDRAL